MEGDTTFPKVVKEETIKLMGLNSLNVRDELCADIPSINVRLKMLQNDGIDAVFGDIANIYDATTQTCDEELEGLLNDYHVQIKCCGNDLAKVMAEVESYAQSNSQSGVVTKALNSNVLLSLFKDNKETLKRYIEYCVSGVKPSEMAKEAARLCKQKKISKENINKKLYDALKPLLGAESIDIKSYENWKSSTNY